MLLSVSDGLLITELKRQNTIDKHKQFSSFDTTKYKNRYKLGFEKKFKGVGIPGFELYVGCTSK